METLDELPQPAFEGTVATDALETDGDNPNEMTDEQFGLLQDRMRQNGWLGGPIITDTDGLIADGEHRWRAADAIGLEEVPVRQYDIDDAERRLWRQELNKIHGEHDTKRDALEYDYLLDAGKADEVHELTQAADEDLDELLAKIKMETSASPAYEYDPEHNVYFEDCVEGMRERLDDDSVDMVFTSPPYNVDIGSQGTRTRGDTHYTDERTNEEFRMWLGEVFGELARVVKPSGHIFINIDHDLDGGELHPVTWVADKMPVPLRSIVRWHKGHGFNPDTVNINYDCLFHLNYEPIFHFTESGSLSGTHTELSSTWEVNPIRGGERQDAGDHPAPYPIELVKRAIMATTDEGDTILDPFMGSGTTAVAAIQNNRDYVGFELDEEGAYKPIIERRIGEAKRQRDAGVNDGD